LALATPALSEALLAERQARDNVRSLLDVDEEAVFSRQDNVPGFVECALVPYLFFQRGF